MNEFYKTEELKLVDVRSYVGVEYQGEAWTFLGYDVVKDLGNGKGMSIFDNTKVYSFLKKYDEHKKVYDHRGLKFNDIRIIEIESLRDKVLGILPVVSKKSIEQWIDNNSSFVFLNYSKDNKVKKIGAKK